MDAANDFSELVRRRARHRCEYCRLPRTVSAMTFELEHVIPLKHGGSDREELMNEGAFDK